ncbi:MAG: ABC transporter substrate-binding protein [Desulfobacterales bacterium]|nr:ABC transporter substrate-binding protein [Desulfobacterales bacterium]
MDENIFNVFNLMIYNAEGAKLVAVINVDTSFGADAIVARQEIKSIWELKGKKIGVQKKTYSEHILDIVLKKNGLSPNDVIKIDFLEEKVADAFINGTFDAIITWEPFVTEAIEKGNGRKLFDTSEIPGICPALSVFHSKFVQERPGDVLAFVNVWHKTTLYIKEHPEDAFKIIADIYSVSIDEVKSFTTVDKILDLQANKIAFTYASGFDSLYGISLTVNKFMIDKGMIEKKMDSSEFFNGYFIRRIK